MDNLSKKNIRLLSEKFDYQIFYVENTLVVKNALTSIIISPVPAKKETVFVEYIVENGVERLETPIYDIYDILIAIFMRRGLEVIPCKSGELINIDLFVREEYYTVKELKQQIVDLQDRNITYEHLRGNRIFVEFYKEILILTDDLSYFKSNVINLVTDSFFSEK